MSDALTLPSLLAANERFYRTFETLDFEALAALWESSERVFCVHPGWEPLHGARAVLESWQAIIGNTGEIRFNLSGEQAHIEGRTGTVTCFETIQNEADKQRSTSGAVSTNLFAFDESAGLWKLFHHHASHTLIPESEEDGVLLV